MGSNVFVAFLFFSLMVADYVDRPVRFFKMDILTFMIRLFFAAFTNMVFLDGRIGFIFAGTTSLRVRTLCSGFANPRRDYYLCFFMLFYVFFYKW